MTTRLLTLLLAAILTGETTGVVLGQTRTRHVEPREQFNDRDDDRDYPPRQYPQRQDRRDGDDSNGFFWLAVIIVLGLAGGGGWYWWENYDDGVELLD